ncbi:MAG: ankyrin repeat domain-containing protein [Leptospirales bacterium]
MRINHMKFSAIIVCLFAITVLLPFAASAAEYAKLSDYFAIKKVSPFFGNDYTEVFVRESKTDKYKSIGTIEKSHWDKPSSGESLKSLKMSVMAISLDGKSLLYRQHGSKKKKGIYWYRVGKGDEFLYPEEDLRKYWALYEKPLPKNVMVLKSSAWPSENEWILSAEDASLQPLALLGSTSFHMAAYQNNLKQIRFAIDQGVNINSENYWGFTPLEIAVKKGFDDIAVFLIEQGADYTHKTRKYLSAIQLAVHLQRWNVIEAIHKKGGRLNATGLFKPAIGGNYIQLMRDDKSSYRPDGSLKMIELILRDGADPNAENSSVIYSLLSFEYGKEMKDKLEILKLLLQYGADPLAVNSGQSTPLHLMASFSVEWNEETKAVLDLLISSMKTLEVKNKSGATALQTSMSRLREEGDFSKALYLIEAGADDSVEYLCGAMLWPMGMSIRQVIAKWANKFPEHYDCSGHK